MEINPIYPEVIIRKGIGTFDDTVNCYNSQFYIFSYPELNLIITDKQSKLDAIRLFFSRDPWKLIGYLNDGQEILCEELFLDTFTGDNYKFIAAGEMKIGNITSQISFSEFPLVGLYGDNINFSYNGWKVNCQFENRKKDDELRDISKIWKIQTETSRLIINCDDQRGQKDYFNFAVNICDLLSLATGNGVTFHRQMYFQTKNDCYEIWRKRSNYYFGTDPIIEQRHLTKFILQTLPKYEKLDAAKRKSIRVAVEYLNSASSGYFDEKVFRVVQAWELIASTFVGEYLLNDELIELKNELKVTIKNWNKKHPELNKDGQINNRVLYSLTWGKLANQMIKLIQLAGCDYEKFNIDFIELKNNRDSVAHTGRLNRNYEPDELIQHITFARYFLRIVILRLLGYSGFVQEPKDRFLVRKSIMDYQVENSFNDNL